MGIYIPPNTPCTDWFHDDKEDSVYMTQAPCGDGDCIGVVIGDTWLDGGSRGC